ILGRGTRVNEETQKYYFNLIDFRLATNHFADPDFDGEPVQVYEPRKDEPLDPPTEPPTDADNDEDAEVVVPDISIETEDQRRRKIYVDGVPATIVAERVEYLDADGSLIMVSLRDFVRRALLRKFADDVTFL